MNREQKLADFAKLVKWEQHYNDHGHQPSLWRAYAERKDLSLERRLWLAFLAVAYSHEGSTWVAWNYRKVSTRKTFPPDGLKIAILRRNLYGGRLKQHLTELYKIRSLTAWVGQFDNWRELLAGLKTIYGNGNWASFTTAETLVQVADLAIVPDEGGFAKNSGPRRALIDLGFEPTEEGVIELVQELNSRGVWVPVQLLETCMCYWQNMNKGKFYLGRSIDRQQNQIEYAESMGVDCAELWAVRRRIFHRESLGEVNGWPGLDKPRLKHYAKTGVMLLPTEKRV